MHLSASVKKEEGDSDVQGGPSSSLLWEAQLLLRMGP